MQRKLNDHVYSFLLFMPSRPHYQAEFYSIKSGPLRRCLRTFARKFSNIDFFLKILPLKDDRLVMSKM